MEKILTKHPEGKLGVNISKEKYEIIKNYILNKLKGGKALGFQLLTDKANKDLKDSFDGKITWYLVTVKLDLEARGLIERVKGKKKQHLKLKS